MSLFIASLNSGSNGNCYYIGNQQEAILVDAGISCREIERRMKRLNLSMQKLRGVFISHEHTDHIRGLYSLVKKYHLPVYITTPTLKNGRLFLDRHYINEFQAHEPLTIGALTVTPFPKLHDAVDPYSFIVSCSNINIGVFTDIGLPCQNVITHFQKCHAAFLEANYDDEMLDNGNYPIHLKKRIRSEYGHLSNRQALELFKKHRPAFMSHLLLSHLSQNNNCPKIVEELFVPHSEGVKIVVASRYEESEVYCISNTAFMQQQYMGPSQLEIAF